MRTCTWKASTKPRTETTKGSLVVKVAEPRGAREPADIGQTRSILPLSSALVRMRQRLEDAMLVKAAGGCCVNTNSIATGHKRSYWHT